MALVPKQMKKQTQKVILLLGCEGGAILESTDGNLQLATVNEVFIYAISRTSFPAI